MLFRSALRALKLPSSHPINKVVLINSKPPDFDFNKKSKFFKKNRPTQISRIWNSIQSLVDLELLEPIQHYKYAPWNRATHYKVEIAEPIQDYFLGLDQNQVTIYTDASATTGTDTTGIGIGLAVLYNNTRLRYQSKDNLGLSQLVYNGELEGITQAAD